jgi:hypothetical protein
VAGIGRDLDARQGEDGDEKNEQRRLGFEDEREERAREWVAARALLSP